MGYFSKTCAKTNLPVLAHLPWGREASRLTTIMVLLPGRTPWKTEYDGYGLDLDELDSAKFVLASDYANERYEDLPLSEDEPNQGFFFSAHLVAELVKLPRFASFDNYFEAVRVFDEGTDDVNEEALNTLRVPYEANKAHRVAALLVDLADGQDRLYPVNLSAFPSLAHFSIEQLRQKAHEFIAVREPQLAALAKRAVLENAGDTGTPTECAHGA